jgi:dihydroorotase
LSGRSSFLIGDASTARLVAQGLQCVGFGRAYNAADVTAPLLIKDGRLIDPARGVDQTADVLVAGGVVRSVSFSPGELKSAIPEGQVLDAEGCFVTPGLIDPHVHLREPNPAHEETIRSGALASARGGFTTVCCMPNTNPPLDSAALIEFVRERAIHAMQAGGARVYPVGCGTVGRQGREPAEIAAMHDAGAVGFSDDGDAIADADVLRRVLTKVKGVGSVFMQHCQDPRKTVGSAMNEGAVATRLGLVGWPADAETELLARDINVNRTVGARYHAQHLSCAGSVDVICAAQSGGQPVSGEAAPHHMLLTDEACATYDPNTKVNPPLRSRADVEAIKHGVAEGVITVLATDHAPHPMHRKSLSFAEAPFGFSSIECALALYIKALIVDGVIDWSAMIRMMTINAAQLVGLDTLGYGSLAAGSPADITVIDPGHEWTIDSTAFVSRGRNCPFAGWRVKGAALATIVGGRVAYLRNQARMTGAAPQHA